MNEIPFGIFTEIICDFEFEINNFPFLYEVLFVSSPFCGMCSSEVSSRAGTINNGYNKKRYDSELPYQRPNLIEVMEIEIELTTSTNVHTSFYKSVRECLNC